MATRNASSEDAEGIARICGYVEVCLRKHRSGRLARLSVADRHAYYAQVIVNGKVRVFVAEIDGTVAGWTALGPDREEADSPALEIQAIYVAPEHWGRGAGQALFDMIVYEAEADGCHQLNLWVLAENERSLRFYRTLGFIKVHRGFPG
jgi:L-amino acid N-acyltransferase YncA